MKPIRSGKVVVVLHGRFAGTKAVVMRTHDDGTKDRPYSHAVVAGISKYPKPCSSKMSEKKRKRRSNISVYVKAINYRHVMPTRYTYDVDAVKDQIKFEKLADASTKRQARKMLKQEMTTRYKAGKNPWFYTKLRF